MGTSALEAEVIISGGGPVGMGLAIELGQRGVSTIVVERHPEPQPVPKGQNLTQRTMEHFHSWGVEAQVRAARTIPASFGIGGLTAYGSLLSGYAYDWLQRELVRPYYFTDNERLPQYATEQVLRARAGALEPVRILYGWSADGAQQDDDGVSLGISPRGEGERQTLRGQYLVGCDGSRSVVREQAGIEQTLSDHDRLMVLLVFRSRGLTRLLERFPGKSFFNILHPSLEGYWLFFGRVGVNDDWFFHAPVPRSAREGDFDFHAFLHSAVGAEFDVEIDHVGYWDLRFATAETYRRGRIFIAGDAAHSHPPYGGYGINTGFEDARNLGWKLAAYLQNWAGERLLDSYSDERRGVFESTARDFIAKAIESDRHFLANFDPEQDRAGFEAEWSARGSGARAEIDAFEPNYEGSLVVQGRRDGRSDAMGTHRFEARPGHHLAPQPLSSGGNVFEALGTGLTLLAFGADEASVTAFKRAAERRRIPLQVVEDDGTAERRNYGSRLILVRPDQFIAWAGDEAADVDRLLLETLGF